MTVFWIAAGVLLACALAFLVVPLTRKSREGGFTRDAINVSVYRDQLRELDADLEAGNITQERYSEALREIEQRVIEDTRDAASPGRLPGGSKRAALVVTIVVPVLAGVVYFFAGTPQALVPGEGAHEIDAQQIVAIAERLAERLKDEPDNPQGWAMLGRAYAALGRFEDASKAYANAVARSSGDAQLLADYADAVAMAQGRRLDGEPEKLIAKALAVDPNNVKALALAGSAAFGRNDYNGAIRHWEKIARVAPPDSELAQSVRSSIDEARALADAAGNPVTTREAPAASTPQAGTISGVVQLAPEVAANVAPDDTVFVFARAAEGPRAPVAVIRARAADLPLQFTLDDRSSVMSGAKLSEQQRVIVGARISKSGSATAQPGDVQGYSKPVAPGTSGLRIVISEISR